MANVKLLPELLEAIASNLRRFGFADTTAQMVRDELAKAPEDRTIIGRMADHILEDNGITDYEV